MAAPDFSLKNPNRARSLLMGYCRMNPAAFHRADAAGYRFWADRCWSSTPSTRNCRRAWPARWTAGARWRTLAQRRTRAVARVAAAPKLSDDVREIVTKASNPDLPRPDPT